MTAAGVLRAIDRDRYDVVPVGITREGRWVLAADDPAALEAHGQQLPSVDESGPGVLVPTSTVDRTMVTLRPGEVPAALGMVDVVLPLLHGPFGEDGTFRDCSSWATCPTSAPASWRRRPVWTSTT
jgi:D-alanine-D-alanine ligase